MAELKRFWLRALNVRQEEKWLVKRLFMLQFLQGAGIAFFFTASFALFLDRFEITDLPWVFIYSAFLLWIAGFTYSRIENRFSGIKLALIVTVFMALSILLFRIAFFTVNNDHFLYWMLAWFNVLYLLNNLEFWGVASLLFNARQSKRLFGVISAGDIPAKFIGYTLALLIVGYIGAINLLWAGFGCMLFSIPFLISIQRSGKLPEVAHVQKHSIPQGGMQRLIINLSSNSLTRSLAILTVIISSSFLLINFAFYAGVKSAYHDEVALAKFIAFFLAFVRIIALVIKMIFTSRLINRLGIINSLLITPIVLLLMILAIVLTQNMSSYQKLILYFFGITSIVVDILRSAINSPVFLTIMQPLPTHERLRAHTIVKGIMDPFASLLTGVLLLVLIYLQQKVDLLTLAYVLLALSVLWIAGIYKVNRQYLRTIIKTISGRYFKVNSYAIDDVNTFGWLKEKLRTGSETESMNILSMTLRSNDAGSIEMAGLALQHDSDKVKGMAIKMIEQRDITISPDLLIPLLDSPNKEMVVASIKALSKFEVTEQLIVPFINHPEIEIRQAALTGILRYGNELQQHNANVVLQQLIASSSNDERAMAAEVLSEQENAGDPDKVLALMNDDIAEVRIAAFYAAARSGNEALLKQLVLRLAQSDKEIIGPLLAAGESALPVIHNAITSTIGNEWQKEKLVLLIGRIGGVKCHRRLLTLLSSHPQYYRPILKALYRSNYVAENKQQEILISLTRKLLAHSAKVVYMQSSLLAWGEKYHLLTNSFQLELNQLRDSLLYIFALLYNRDNISRVRSAYLSQKRENIINAMEIIDITVRKDFAAHFNTIFEPGNNIDRMDALRKIYPAGFIANVEDVLEKTLTEEKKPYHNWTKACTFYTSKKQHHTIDPFLIDKYMLVDNPMVRETAKYAG